MDRSDRKTKPTNVTGSVVLRHMQKLWSASGIAAALVLWLAVSPFSALARSIDFPKSVTAQIQQDTAKLTRLRVSCGHPNRKSYSKRRGIMSFALKAGDVGNCYTDKRADHSAAHVPYMERVEMYSDFRKVGPRYRFSALIHMDPAFVSSPETTIFQVHQWVQESCQCGPPVMLSFDKSGGLRAWILTRPHDHSKIPLKGWTRKSFENKWVEIAVDITSAYGRQNVTIWLGGQKVLSRKAMVQPGGALFTKVGLYRPGSKKKKLPSDRVHVRDVRISVLK